MEAAIILPTQPVGPGFGAQGTAPKRGGCGDVDRESGEAVLLIFEDIAHRKQPLQVIRFRSGRQTR